MNSNDAIARAILLRASNEELLSTCAPIFMEREGERFPREILPSVAFGKRE
jgi:hypothetical protein